MAATFLVRYGELALKSPPVRREFERTLERNILERFRAAGLPCRLRSDHGHFYVVADDAPRAGRFLRTIFGVTSVSEVTEVESEEPKIAAALLTLADPALVDGSRYAVRARRVGSHPFTSQELAGRLGAAIGERFADRHLRVDLTHPTVELQVEVRGPRTYLSLDRARGPGGLPLGVAGSLVALVDGPRGALGAYLMMKRGCTTAVVVDEPGRSYADDVLRCYAPSMTVEPAGADPLGVLGALAERVRADGVVLPLAVEQYSEARAQWGDRVLFSPTVGFSEEEVAERWAVVRARAN
ncbi:MAG TPA: THUMP domain-containing protein [Thermoplasmata archaeon]|nr:THUMP domain-containing protein [Thermoplasmata archaeon]